MISHFRRELSISVTLVLLLTFLAFRAPSFFGADNLRNTVVQNAPVLLVATGMALVILARQIDISVGSQFSWCAVMAGVAAQEGYGTLGMIATAILVGAIFGAINGTLVAYFGLPPIVATLATMVIGRESLRWHRQGEFLYDLPTGFQWLGLGQTAGQIAIVSIAIIVFIAVAIVLRSTSPGRTIYAVGSDPEAARLAGLRPKRVIFTTFLLLGVFSAGAAVLGTIRFSTVDPNAGNGLEMKAIAAVVLGGVAISGGRGSLIGVFLAVVLLGCISPALVFLGLPAQWEKAVQGLIILTAVAADALERRGEK